MVTKIKINIGKEKSKPHKNSLSQNIRPVYVPLAIPVERTPRHLTSALIYFFFWIDHNEKKLYTHLISTYSKNVIRRILYYNIIMWRIVVNL